VTIRILVVDDVEDLRRLVRYALERHGGFEVVGEAAAGGEAIRVAGNAQPDVVLLDLGLPDIAGEEVLTRLRDVSPGARVVVFTAKDVKDHALFDEYAAGFVTKGSVDLRYLVGLLEDVGRTGYREASQLATNAVVHARSAFVVRLKLSPVALRIEVTDAAADGTPQVQPEDHGREGGRGLLLVSAVSSSWGVEPSGESGKLTWAEIAGA
jgi:DNA-binding NarL/FixJ family response regulator